MCEKSRFEPRLVSRGYFLISMRHPGSSTRCQWNVFSFRRAISSSRSLTAAMPWKCLLSSSMNARQGKAGASGNHAARHDDGAVSLLSQLTQGLQGVQKACLCIGSGDDLLLAVGRLHGQPIGLVVVVQRRLVEPRIPNRLSLAYRRKSAKIRSRGAFARHDCDRVPLAGRARPARGLCKRPDSRMRRFRPVWERSRFLRSGLRRCPRPASGRPVVRLTCFSYSGRIKLLRKIMDGGAFRAPAVFPASDGYPPACPGRQTVRMFRRGESTDIPKRTRPGILTVGAEREKPGMHGHRVKNGPAGAGPFSTFPIVRSSAAASTRSSAARPLPARSLPSRL